MLHEQAAPDASSLAVSNARSTYSSPTPALWLTPMFALGLSPTTLGVRCWRYVCRSFVRSLSLSFSIRTPNVSVSCTAHCAYLSFGEARRPRLQLFAIAKPDSDFEFYDRFDSLEDQHSWEELPSIPSY